MVNGLGESPHKSNSPDTLRRTVLFSGRVQGVGFRQTTCRIAREFPITGYVMNLPDGRVEALAEGEAAAVTLFFERVGEVMARNIRTAEASDEPGPARFPGFAVRY